MVTSAQPGSEGYRIEFELTTNNHMSDSRVPKTVTACFKEPTPDLIPEAWRILTAVVDDKALFPAKYKEVMAKTLNRHSRGVLNCQIRHRDTHAADPPRAVEHTEPPGSASDRSAPSQGQAPESSRSEAVCPPPARPVPVLPTENTEPPGPARPVPVLPTENTEPPVWDDLQC